MFMAGKIIKPSRCRRARVSSSPQQDRRRWRGAGGIVSILASKSGLESALGPRILAGFPVVDLKVDTRDRCSITTSTFGGAMFEIAGGALEGARA